MEITKMKLLKDGEVYEIKDGGLIIYVRYKQLRIILYDDFDIEIRNVRIGEIN
jgi:hypothetical protein